MRVLQSAGEPLGRANASWTAMRRATLTFFSKRSRAGPLDVIAAKSATRTSSSSSPSRSAAAIRRRPAASTSAALSAIAPTSRSAGTPTLLNG